MRSFSKRSSLIIRIRVKDSQYHWKQWIYTTFNEASFDREYGSVWTGSAENAFFDGAKFDHSRVLNVPEYEPTGRSGKLSYYILSMDVGRKGCASVVCVFKVTP